MDRGEEVLDDGVRAGVAHLVLADAPSERLYNVELDDSLDQPVDVAVQHRRELCDRLALPVFACLVDVHEHRVRSRQLHQAAGRRPLHLERRVLAPQDEGDEADGARDVVVRELHEVAAGDDLRAEAREDDLQHPQSQEARRARLHPLVRLHARQQHVVDLVHALEQPEELLLGRPGASQEEADLCERLEAHLVDVEGVRGAAGQDHGLDVVEDDLEVP
mmetsp:Transcript_43279/g.114471  ORF Transcript_43279/g.114471 Transcript_43279/m.114471 type:complete len:219 (+) Transcript_43279:1450-2106(+)